MLNQPPQVFGTYCDSPRPYSFNGMLRLFYTPFERIWVSPNPITVTNGVASGSPLYAASLNLDGTLVFQDQLAARDMGIDSPPPSSVRL